MEPILCRKGAYVPDPISVLFVCLGNICRSPLAEAVFRKVVTEAGLEGRVHVDSAGTSGYHDGEGPDERTTAVAARRGVRVAGTSRRITAEDLARFDYVVVMDRENRRAVERLVSDAGASPALHLFREFDPEADGEADVPDPYFGGPDGFENVHELVERSARGLLDHVRAVHGL